jgi:hypothetical protein
MVVLGGDNEEVQRIIKMAKEYSGRALIPDDNWKTADRYRIATLFEDATDLKEVDPVTALYFLNRAVNEVIDFLFMAGCRTLPRAKERITQIEACWPEMGKLISDYYEAREFDAKYAAAKSLVEKSVGATGFFEWESERS